MGFFRYPQQCSPLDYLIAQFRLTFFLYLHFAKLQQAPGGCPVLVINQFCHYLTILYLRPWSRPQVKLRYRPIIGIGSGNQVIIPSLGTLDCHCCLIQHYGSGNNLNFPGGFPWNRFWQPHHTPMNCG